MDAIQQIGAFAGLGAFFGLAVLAFLYFAQARHVRDLEEKATYLPEDLDLPTTPAPAPAPVPATGDEDEEEAEEGTAEAAAPPPPRTEAEAARQVQIARAKAERRKRFEERRRTPGGGDGPPRERVGSAAGRSRPEPRAMIVIGLGVAVLALGVVFAAGRILGGNDNSSSSGSAATAEGQSTGPPTQVAVLNGTPVPGLAAKVAQDVRAAHFNPKPVSNTDTPFDETEVMFDTAADKSAQTDAQAVASALKIAKIATMDNDVKRAAGGAGVAVVVGEDRAGT